MRAFIESADQTLPLAEGPKKEDPTIKPKADQKVQGGETVDLLSDLLEQVDSSYMEQRM